ncbi:MULTISPECIES: LmeA family phospholipid-binding protein [Streptomyces]|uniref:LmeA family phospholipid-binding protein n=1 Tax=Streptomyces TaxID=1883 RepID=UPI0033FC0C36
MKPHPDGCLGHRPDPGDDFASVRPPRRRMRRRAVVFATCLFTVGATAVIVDRVAASRVESRTAEAFQKGMGTPERPSVDVRGFPVLPQLASGTLRRVDITAEDIPARGNSRPLPVTRLTVGLDELQTSSDADQAQAQAQAVDATAFLSYEDLSDALGLEIEGDSEPGRVRAQIALPFSGDVTVSTAVAAVSANRIAFTDFSVTEGRLPAAGQALLAKVIAEPIQLRNIPEGLHLRSVTVAQSGLNTHFTGDRVTFRPDTAAA